MRTDVFQEGIHRKTEKLTIQLRIGVTNADSNGHTLKMTYQFARLTDATVNEAFCITGARKFGPWELLICNKPAPLTSNRTTRDTINSIKKPKANIFYVVFRLILSVRDSGGIARVRTKRGEI